MLQNNIYGYTDMFEASVRVGRRICAEELAKMFFALPPWVVVLMKLRNALMKPLGLKGEKSLGEYLLTESDSVATVSKKDRHLNLLVVFRLEENNDGNQKISFSTNVCFNNGMGRFYFALIKPFHTFICKKMLKRVVRKLER